MHGRVSSTAVNQLLWSKQNLTELRKLTNINYKHIGHSYMYYLQSWQKVNETPIKNQ